jgi:UDP-2,3-diacylglucosamine hydrolase
MKAYFASDLHLGAGAIADKRAHEQRFVAWLDSIKVDATHLFLLGDVFDFWYEYKRVVPKGYLRFLGKLAELSDSGIEIHFFTGNHDVWVFDYFTEELGIVVHQQPITLKLGAKTFYLAHGDGLGDPSFGFRFIRGMFHNKILQWLFAKFIHPNLALRFGLWWSKHSRLSKEEPSYKGEQDEHLVRYAKDFSEKHPDIDFFVFGHRHIILDLQLKNSSRVVILGDWFREFSYGEFDGEEFFLNN